MTIFSPGLKRSKNFWHALTKRFLRSSQRLNLRGKPLISQRHMGSLLTWRMRGRASRQTSLVEKSPPRLFAGQKLPLCFRLPGATIKFVDVDDTLCTTASFAEADFFEVEGLEIVFVLPFASHPVLLARVIYPHHPNARASHRLTFRPHPRSIHRSRGDSDVADTDLVAAVVTVQALNIKHFSDSRLCACRG